MNNWFITNSNGTCLTYKGLEDLMPRDDRETPSLEHYAYKILFKDKGSIIPDCRDDELHFDEEMQLKGIDLMTSVFDAPPLPKNIPQVPVPGSAALIVLSLIAALILLMCLKGGSDD